MKNKEYAYYNVTQIADLKDMLYKKAEAMPDNTSFIYPCESGEMKKTYADLLEDVNAFGTWMYSKKIIDTHVGILGENSYEWLVAYLATVIGGSVAVAIDKNLPEDEVEALAKLGDVETAFVSKTYFDKVGKKMSKNSYSF